MDWLSLGQLGTYTFLLKRVYPTGAALLTPTPPHCSALLTPTPTPGAVSVEVAVPMLLGVITSVVAQPGILTPF